MNDQSPQIPGYQLGDRLGDRTFQATAERFDQTVVVRIHRIFTLSKQLRLQDMEPLHDYLERLRELASLDSTDERSRVAPLLDYDVVPLIAFNSAVGRDISAVAVYVTLPYFSNGDIGNVRWSDRQLVDAMGFICDGLAHLDHAGLWHGRLIPDFIFLDSNWHPVLAYPLLAEPTMLEMKVTGHHRQIRAAGFLSPEWIRSGTQSIRSDIYSIGCILYEQLTGHPPFMGKVATDVAMLHLDKEPEPLPAEHVLWQPIVSRCLAKSEKDRFASPRELKQAMWTMAGRGNLPAHDPTCSSNRSSDQTGS